MNYTLKSPGYPNNYPNDMDCTYQIPIPPGMAMKVYFKDFYVEALSGAPCEWVNE